MPITVIGKIGMRNACIALLLLLSSSFGAPERSDLSRLGKRTSYTASASINSLVALVRKSAEALRISTPPFIYHMDYPEQRRAMIEMLWTGNYRAAIGRFTSFNLNLVSFFEQQHVDDDSPTRFHELTGAMPRFESVLTQLFRSRSQKLVPIEIAALSIYLLHFQCSVSVWRAIAYFGGGLIMSRTWTETLIDEALLHPANCCPYVVAGGITGAIFDNFRLKCNYGSYSTMDSTGYALDMTNWATVFIAAVAVPGGSIDMKRIIGAGGMFRLDLILDAFIDLFSIHAPDIVNNQHSRWREFLTNAEQGLLGQKQPFASPYPPTYFHYHTPIFDRGQSSYVDVNFCLDLMRDSVYHKYSDAIMLGGDGLSYMRLIDRIAQEPRRYLERTPVIIPRLGEAPHGKFHVLHGHWRLWEPLIMRCAIVTNNKQVVSDPSVSQFNSHEHYVRIMTRAFAEYVVEISATGMDFNQSRQFMSQASRNLSFAYICNFLFLFGFHYIQFRAAVRRNDSHVLDRLWREFLGTARTDLANKTNYSKMVVNLIYWGCGLVAPLQAVYHNTRTIRLLHTHVGWDMPIEVLNLWIRLAVVYNVTKDFLIKFILRLNFTHVVMRGVDAIMKRRQKNMDGLETLKNIDTDVEAIKEFLRLKIGTTWAEATTPSDANLLSLDMAEWGGDRSVAAKRQNTPWAQIQRSMNDYRTFVTERIAHNCPWHIWR